MITTNDKTRVVVGMSGGVDSSVAAALLKKEGYHVSGVTMKIWGGEGSPEEGNRHACYGPGEEEDIEDARQVAQALGIPFHIIDLRDEYRNEVLDYYCREYLSGRTPNPCLKCNRTVKFGALLKKARESGLEFDYFATGHYARVKYSRESSRYLLEKARDLSKDQSYFLSYLSQEQLGSSLFPLGSYTKSEVRKMAADFGLAIKNKPESQDFAAGDYRSLITESTPGPVMDSKGNILGEHRGIPFYTIGQRKGLGISGEEPRYVIDIDAEKNAIITGSKEDLYRDKLVASGMNWISIKRPEQPFEAKARIRYRHQEAAATIRPIGDCKVYVKFQQSQPAITPGQTVVFYNGDTVLGGGTIEGTEE